MRSLFMLAGAGVLLAMGAPSAADAKPKGKAAKVHVNAKGHIDMNRNGVPDWREQRWADVNGNGILDWRENRRVDINRNGIPDWRERFIDRDRDGIDDRQESMMNRWGGAICPPGLAWRNPPCVPPGQVGRSWHEGQRLPANYRWFTPWGSIPIAVRTQYSLDDDYRYIIQERYIYEVDPATRMVRRIIDLLL